MIALISGLFDKPSGGSILELPTATSGPTLGRVIEELIATKKASNRRPAYIRQLRCYLNQFARGRESWHFKSITRQHLEQWFASRNDAPITRNTGRQLLGVLFSYAIRVGYVDKNPTLQIERVLVDAKPPRILTPGEARRMLNYARRGTPWRLPQLVLGLYAGIRPTELQRLYWRDINMERGYVTINAAASKTRQRRIVHLDPKCIAWLRRCKVSPKKRIGSAGRRWTRMIKENTGIQWSQDCLRHSAASYLLAKHADVGKVARMLGNSPNVLLRHYFELVGPEDCRRFWKCPPMKLNPF